MSTIQALDLPPHYDPKGVVDSGRRIDFWALQQAAIEWRRQHGMKAVAGDSYRLGLLGIDVQDTFCHPQGELYVAGADGLGAVNDGIRLVEFGYRYMHLFTGMHWTLDTHRLGAIFHPYFLVDQDGNHPAPFTMVKHADITSGQWTVNPFMSSTLGMPLQYLQKQLEYYTRKLEERGRYELTIWPYHGMFPDTGYCPIKGVTEMANFHGFARGFQPGFEVKGTHPLAESYSVLGPEVAQLWDKKPVGRSTGFLEKLLRYDALVIAGQAKSHCVAWTISDLLDEIVKKDRELAKKVYLLEDCTTAIVVKAPNGDVVYDYNPDANAAFDKFRNAGMHVVRSTDPIESWPGIRL